MIFRKLRGWVLRASGLWLALGFLLAVWGGYGTFRLYAALRPDLEELLPRTAPAVVDAERIQGRLESSDYLAVLAFSEEPEKARSFILALNAALEPKVPTEIAYLEYEAKEAVEFFRSHQALFLDATDLRDIESYVGDRIQYEKDKLVGGLFGATWDKPTYDFGALEAKYRGRNGGFPEYPGGEYATQDGKVRSLLVGIRNERKNVQGSYELRNVVDAALATLPEETKAGVKIRFTGGVQDILEEHSSLIKDLGLVTTIVLLLTIGSMWLYFGNTAAVWTVLVSLLFGVLWACGLSYALIGYVNMNSAFLGSIIIGNGINFGIILMARFKEELRKGRSLLRALIVGLRTTPRATLTASLAAGIAYGSLMVTDFRGFRQFGIMAFIGMIFCWLAAYTILPVTINLMCRTARGARALRSQPPDWVQVPFCALARVLHASPRPFLFFGAFLTFVSACAIYLHTGSYLETDLTRMRDIGSLTYGSGHYSQYLHKIFQGYPHPLAVLAPDSVAAARVHSSLREASQQPDTRIGRVLGVKDIVPDNQAEKITILKRIHGRLATYRTQLEAAERRRIDKVLTPEARTGYDVGDLPELVKRKLREKDGSLGRLILVEPIIGKTEALDDLLGFIDELRGAVASASPQAAVSGTLAVSADLIRSIAREGPRTTALAFALIFVLSLLHFRVIRLSGLLLGSVVLGVFWMVGVMAAFDLKLNFLNFIALPMTFGIALDYGVNILERYKLEGRGRIREVITETGGAVFLASLTTIIGYGGLLLAGNQAIVSFGQLAVLGEFTCLAAAMLTVPAWLAFQDRANEPAAPEPDASVPAETADQPG